MSTYRAPLRDMQFALRELAGIEEIATLPGCERDARRARLGARGGCGVCLRRARSAQSRRRQGRLHVERRRGQRRRPVSRRPTSSSREAGWIGLPVPTEYGGQGLPQILLGPTLEMWNARQHRLRQRPAAQPGRDRSDRAGRLATSRSSATFPTWSPGSGPARCVSPSRRPAPTSRRCARALCLTATTTSSAARRSSSRSASTTWPRTSSTSCSRVLPDAPEGTKGISLFIVPKFLVNDDGSSASATTSSARASSTSSASTAIRPARSTTARRARAPSAISSASPIAASSICSS